MLMVYELDQSDSWLRRSKARNEEKAEISA